MLKAALRLASLGWFVLPLVPRQKRPLTRHGVNDASKDEKTICEWFEREPNANLGIATGPSNLLVIDVDGTSGEEAVRKLRLPPTVSAITRRGKHFYFERKVPLRSTSKRLGLEIDTRGLGGYVLAPPSFCGKRYRWKFAPYWYELAPLPETIAEQLRSLGNFSPESGGRLQALEDRPRDTSRSGIDASKTYTLVREGLSDEAIKLRFEHFSEKYEEKLDRYGSDTADGYFWSVLNASRRFFDHNRQPAKVLSAELEILGPTSDQASLARIILTLATLDDGEIVTAKLTIPDGRNKAGQLWEAVMGDTDPAAYLEPNGWVLAQRLRNTRLDVIIRDDAVVWMKARRV